MTLYADQVDGSLSITENGYSAERVFVVNGLSGPATDRLQRAITASGVPSYGDPYPAPVSPIAVTANSGTDVLTATSHPHTNGTAVVLSTTGVLPAPLVTGRLYYARDVSGSTLKLAATSGGSAIDITDTGTGTHYIGVHLGCFVTSVSVSPVESGGAAKIVASYEVPSAEQTEVDASDPGMMSVGTTVAEGTTQKDKDGNQITISLTDQPDQVGEVSIQVPESVITFERRESASPHESAVDYVGKVNSASLGGGTFAARTLLCVGIEGDTNDNGATWTVTYRFQYRSETWDATIVYIDPETDRPHADIDLSVGSEGWESVQIYSTADFSTLGLGF